MSGVARPRHGPHFAALLHQFLNGGLIFLPVVLADEYHALAGDHFDAAKDRHALNDSAWRVNRIHRIADDAKPESVGRIGRNISSTHERLPFILGPLGCGTPYTG